MSAPPVKVLYPEDLMRMAGVSKAYLSVLVSGGRLPKPSGQDGRRSTWREVDVRGPMADLVRRRRKRST